MTQTDKATEAKPEVELRVTWAKQDREFWLHMHLPDGKSAGINLGDPIGMIAWAALRACVGHTFSTHPDHGATVRMIPEADYLAAMQAKDAEIAELMKDVTFLQSGKDLIRDELQAENERLREALSLIAVMGYSDDPKVAANIARMAVDQSRADLQRKAGE